MDALEILQADHEQVRNWFEEIRKTTDFAEKLDLFEMIREALTVHTEIEESVFYPAFKSHEEMTEFLDEFYEEHQEFTELMEEIDETEDEDMVSDLIEELAESVDHHVSMEEEEFFAKVRELMTPEMLAKLGEEIEAAKQRHSRAA